MRRFQQFVWFIESERIKIGKSLGSESFNSVRNYKQKETWYAQKPCQLAYLDYSDFCKVLKRIQADKEQEIKEYLEKIPFFQDVQPYLLKQIVGKLEER